MNHAQFLKACGWSQERIDQHLKDAEERRLHCELVAKERESIREEARQRGACFECARYTWCIHGKPKYIRHRHQKNCPRKGRSLR